MTNETRDITTDPADIKRIITPYYEQFYPHKFDKLDEMYQFLKKTQTIKHTIFPYYFLLIHVNLQFVIIKSLIKY